MGINRLLTKAWKIKKWVKVVYDHHHAWQLQYSFKTVYLKVHDYRFIFCNTCLCFVQGVSTSVFKTSHSYVSFHSTHSNLKARAYVPGTTIGDAANVRGATNNGASHSLTNVSDVSSEVWPMVDMGKKKNGRLRLQRQAIAEDTVVWRTSKAISKGWKL